MQILPADPALVYVRKIFLLEPKKPDLKIPKK